MSNNSTSATAFSTVQKIALFITEPELTDVARLSLAIEQAHPAKFEISSSTLDPQRIPDGPLLAVVHAPYTSLALRLKKLEASPDAALVEWCEWAEILLQSHRKNRRNFTLIDPSVLIEKKSEDYSALARRLQLDLSDAKAEFDSEKPEPILLACASTLINSDQKARALAEEIMAAMVSGETALEIPSVIGKTLTSWKTTTLELASLSTENELLRENLEQCAEEIKNTHNREGLTSGEVGKLKADRQRLIGERDAMIREVATQKANIQKIFSTLSWRVTKPLRAIRSRVPRSAK